MITQIGIAAGDIWHILDQKGEVKLSELQKSLDRPHEIVLMSVGWLAREGHVVLNKVNNDYTVSLRR